MVFLASLVCQLRGEEIVVKEIRRQDLAKELLGYRYEALGVTGAFSLHHHARVPCPIEWLSLQGKIGLKRSSQFARKSERRGVHDVVLYSHHRSFQKAIINPAPLVQAPHLQPVLKLLLRKHLQVLVVPYMWNENIKYTTTDSLAFFFAIGNSPLARGV